MYGGRIAVRESYSTLSLTYSPLVSITKGCSGNFRNLRVGSVAIAKYRSSCITSLQPVVFVKSSRMYFRNFNRWWNGRLRTHRWIRLAALCRSTCEI